MHSYDHMPHPLPDTQAEYINCPICGGSARYEFSSRDLMFGLYARYDYFACTVCETSFQHPTPSPGQIASFYPHDYSVYDETESKRTLSAWRRALLREYRGYTHLDVPYFLRMLAKLLGPLATPPGTPSLIAKGRLLDVGCGNGRYLSTMRTLGWDVQGVEFSENGVAVCRKSGLPVHHGELASAGFDDDSFDLITLRHVIEHIPRTHELLAEVARILKPGGQVMIETPNRNALGRDWFGAKWFANEVPRHLYLFSAKGLHHMAQIHRLEACHFQCVTSPKIFLNSLDYVLNNKDLPSRKVGWRRLLARIYMMMARRSGRGDVIQAAYRKPATFKPVNVGAA